MLAYDSGTDTTHVFMDTNGDGVSDRQIDIAGDHHTYNNFDGLAA